MGAHTFRDTIGGKGMTPEQAYRALVDEALYQYGHDSYSGTIATTRGFVVVNADRRGIDKTVDAILDDSASKIRKWGPAGCIELKGDALTRWRKANGLAGTRARAYLFFGWAAS